VTYTYNSLILKKTCLTKISVITIFYTTSLNYSARWIIPLVDKIERKTFERLKKYKN